MPGQPVCHALAEGMVIEISGELADWPVRNGYGINQTLITHPLRSKQTHVIRGCDSVLEPPLSPEVSAFDPKGNFVSRILHGLSNTRGKFWGDALVGIQIKHPWMSKRDIREPPVLVR